MVFYKGTKTKIQNYISMVDNGQNYQGVTTTWAQPMEISGDWYVVKHEDYEATNGLTVVSSLPVVEDESLI